MSTPLTPPLLGATIYFRGALPSIFTYAVGLFCGAKRRTPRGNSEILLVLRFEAALVYFELDKAQSACCLKIVLLQIERAYEYFLTQTYIDLV